jgi:hypothetical protein
MPKTPAGPRYWIAVVPRAGVERCLAAGFAMFAHGRRDAIMRTQPGEWLAYYCPRTLLKGGEEVRAFCAIGRFADREPYETELMPGRVGWCRDIAFQADAHEAGVYPLLDRLSFIRDRAHWGLFFHRSLFSVPRDDFATIAGAMGVAAGRL